MTVLRRTTGDAIGLSLDELRSARLADHDWHRAALSGLDLDHVDFSGANMRNAEFRGAVVVGAQFSDANLIMASFRGAVALQACFREARLRHADLTGADLRDADFTNADLTGASLTGADVEGARFVGASLADAVLNGSNITAAQLAKAHATGSEPGVEGRATVRCEVTTDLAEDAMVVEVWRDGTLVAEIFQREGSDDEIRVYSRNDEGPGALTRFVGRGDARPSNGIAEFARTAREFCVLVESGGAGPRHLLAAMARLQLGVLQLPDVDDDTIEAPDLSLPPLPPNGLSRDVYGMVFDPLVAPPGEPVCGSLVDDLSDIRADLRRGLHLFDAGHEAAAVWEWRFHYAVHWGAHLAAAQMALFHVLVS